MSVEALELMENEWTRWQGHLVDGVYPLGRVLGGSDHSGVFETRLDAPRQGQGAIKLLRTSQPQEAAQLARWVHAGGLTHPHLLSLLRWGRCQLDGVPYLYLVMEYADQTLAQVLQRRALSADEAREMLVPMLGALDFLHRQNLVLGRLKPTNVLVVGDQLKLASDTIRRVGDDLADPPSAYDPPKGLAVSNATSGDVWAVGLSLLEALTHQAPPSRGGIALPADFTPAFRDVVSRCLSTAPQDRPGVAELLAWTGGATPVVQVPSSSVLTADVPAVSPPTEAATVVSTPPAQPMLDQAAPAPRPAPAAPPARGRISAAIVAAVVVAVGWGAVRSLTAHHDSVPASAASDLAAATPLAESLGTAPAQADPHAASGPRTGNGEAAPISAVHEVIPAVLKSAARTLRGQVSVLVRATLRPDGSVASVSVDRGGPSKYFQRLALQTAKKWTFAPVHGAPPRTVLIQFDFTRDGAMAHLSPLPPG